MDIRQEDAEKEIIEYLREQRLGSTRYNEPSSYGYDLYIPNVIRRRFPGSHPFHVDKDIAPVSPIYYAAAWDLCRRGIIRPGVKSHMAQSTDQGNAGNGYSVTPTPFGDVWLAESTHDDFVPTEPERFGQLLAGFKSLLGPGYHQRG